jgi:V8-like Glu-specific endopeptidase
MLKQIYACHAAAGLTDASSPGGPDSLDAAADLPSFVFMPSVIQAPEQKLGLAAPAVGPSGWSNNVDTRVMRTPTTTWPWRAITQSSSWPSGEDSFCTMTLIGPRHLVTAAHCLVDFGTSNWKSRKLTPGRNGIDVEPYGVSRMTPNPPPGEEAWYLVPEPWIDPSTPDNIDKYQWDIGMVLMLDRLGDQTGWMGYGAYPASDLNHRQQINRGYPRCERDYAEEPAACPKDADDDRDAVARLFGDIGYCEIGEYHHPGSNGWNRNFSFDCDMSRGHSGSPLYHYRYSTTLGRDVPVVAAVVSWHECTTCGADDDFPNHARRITPWVRDKISWLRETFP